MTSDEVESPGTRDTKLSTAETAVLVLGVCLIDQENTAAATVAELSRSRDWVVEQRWLALGRGSVPAALAHVTAGKVESNVPKFILLNQLLAATEWSKYAYIIVCDDDVSLAPGFLDDYLRIVRAYDFALCQPAHTPGSYLGSRIGHRFVEQRDGLLARRTRFVEIGPLFSIRRDAAPFVLPFDETSPMGWGYDFVWPRVLGDAGLKLGIVDVTPIGHTVRKTASQYDEDTARQQMQRYLQSRPHLSKREAFSTVESYPTAFRRRAPGAGFRHRVAASLLERIRHVKQFLVAKDGLWRTLIPFSDALEVCLTEGFREVVVRAKGRILGRPVLTAAVRAQMAALGGPRPSPTLPPRLGPGGVSIVIPVLDQASLTLNCLKAIVDHSKAGSYEVIVVDNGSGDATRNALATVSGLRLIRNETNVGFVGACNQGAGLALGEFVLFLNNDTLVRPGWLEALTGTFARDPSVGAVGAKLLCPDGRLQEAGGIIWSDGVGWNYGRNRDPEAPDYSFVREVDYCSGACLIVRRELFEGLGGFDQRYAPAYYEDTDLCFRLRERGYRVLYQPAAQVIHIEGATAGTDVSRGIKSYQQVNHRKFVERHSEALNAQHDHDPELLDSARDRKRGKRILVVDHMVPHHDQDSGSVRMTAILQILGELGHRVTFLPDNLARIEPYTAQLQQLGVEVLYGSISALAYLEEHLARFDVVILCRARFAKRYLPTILDAPRRPFLIFDTIDLHHLREQRHAELLQDPQIARSAAETKSIEVSVMQASDMVWVTSTHEAEVLRGYNLGPQVEVIPNIHEVRNDVPGFADRRDLLFIGGFRHPPNEDAVLYFVHTIWPMVKRDLPGVKFKIVGSLMPPSILELASQDVDVLGFVKDVEPVFDAVRLSVAPLRYGAGVKGKISQSLAWGVPVVTTPVGAEGMYLHDREHAMIVADPAEFARRVVEVYQDEALWTRLSRDGRRHIHTHLGYETVRVKLDALLRQSRDASGGRTAAADALPWTADTDIVYAGGFLSPERENGSTWRWMGREGLIRLRNTHRDMLLTIQGRAPAQLTEPPAISIEFDGKPLDRIVGTELIERTYEIPAASQGAGASSELRIRTSRTMVPHEVDPGSGDQRRLGFSLFSLSWGLKPDVGASLEAPAREPESPIEG